MNNIHNLQIKNASQGRAILNLDDIRESDTLTNIPIKSSLEPEPTPQILLNLQTIRQNLNIHDIFNSYHFSRQKVR